MFLGGGPLRQPTRRQLAHQQGPFGISWTFTYDQAGNRTLMQDNPGVQTTSAYDGAS